MGISSTRSNWTDSTFPQLRRSVFSRTVRIGTVLGRLLLRAAGIGVSVVSGTVRWVGACLAVTTTARRSRAFGRFARARELSFNEDGRGQVGESFTRLPLFQEGEGGTIRFVLAGTFLNARFRMFDYSPFDVGREWHTVVAFEIRKSRIPNFAVWPLDAQHRDGPWFGKNNLEVAIPEAPDLAARYVVRGSNPEAVRRLFPRRALQYFGRTCVWSVEGGGEWLIAYRQDHRCGNRQFESFLKDAWSIFRLFRLQ